MIRFRFTEDERRHLLLRSEVYRLISQHLEPNLVFKVMRNFSKMEELVHFEGVRQGFAAAELSLLMENADAGGYRDLKAFQAHALIYGSSDTPLRALEIERLANLSLPEDAARGAWLDDAPMRFAPQTLAEWEGEQAVAPVGEDVSFLEHIANLKKENPDAVPFVEGAHPDKAPFDTADWHALTKGDDNTDQPPDSPQFLDRVRDHLQAASEKYDSWQDLVFKLHIGMQVDAGYLDLILSTPEGLTVLAQCNQTHLHPGAEMNLQGLKGQDP